MIGLLIRFVIFLLFLLIVLIVVIVTTLFYFGPLLGIPLLLLDQLPHLLQSSLAIFLVLILQCMYNGLVVGALGLFQNRLEDFTFDVLSDFLLLVVPLLQPVKEDRVVALDDKDQVEPSLGEEFASVVFDDVPSFGHFWFHEIQ